MPSRWVRNGEAERTGCRRRGHDPADVGRVLVQPVEHEQSGDHDREQAVAPRPYSPALRRAPLLRDCRYSFDGSLDSNHLQGGEMVAARELKPGHPLRSQS